MIGCPTGEIDDETVLAAAAELANLAAGSATELLRSAGFAVEIGPPRLHGVGASVRLAERAVAVTIETSQGSARVLLELVEIADVG
jgi:CheY-specific phosphatase CheX